MALWNTFGFVVERVKCYLIFQLTITITVDISIDSSNCPYTGQLLKWEKEEVWVPPLTGSGGGGEWHACGHLWTIFKHRGEGGKFGDYRVVVLAWQLFLVWGNFTQGRFAKPNEIINTGSIILMIFGTLMLLVITWGRASFVCQAQVLAT